MNLTSLGITGIIAVVIGLIITLIGLILLFIHHDRNKPWYIWILTIIGFTLGILGSILLSIDLTNQRKVLENIKK